MAVIGPVAFPAVAGGLTRHCEELYVRLAEKGIAATVYTRRGPGARRRSEYRGLQVIALRVPRVRGVETLVYGALASVHALFADFDVVHHHGVASGTFCFAQRLRPKRRLVFTHHRTDWTDDKWGRTARALLLWTARVSLRLAHVVIAVSRSLASDLRAIRERAVVVVPNGVALPETGDARRLVDLGLTPGRYALCVSRIVPEKGLHVVVEAFRSLGDTGLDLAIVGAPRYSQDYADELARSGGERVRFLGQRSGPDLGALYANAALFITASANEGLPLGVLEAMGFGLRVVASDIPAHREAMDGSGVLFPAGDPAALAAAVRSALEAPPSVDPREIVERNGYSWDAIADRTYELLIAVGDAHA